MTGWGGGGYRNTKRAYIRDGERERGDGRVKPILHPSIGRARLVLRTIKEAAGKRKL